nr:hypothetical protein [Chloracidobacterium sp. D]
MWRFRWSTRAARKAQREEDYPGVTSITKQLLDHWRDPEDFDARRFFCQLEAVETLIWLTEAPAAERTSIETLATTEPSHGSVAKWRPARLEGRQQKRTETRQAQILLKRGEAERMGKATRYSLPDNLMPV